MIIRTTFYKSVEVPVMNCVAHYYFEPPPPLGYEELGAFYIGLYVSDGGRSYFWFQLIIYRAVGEALLNTSSIDLQDFMNWMFSSYTCKNEHCRRKR